jgi:hypothetical protein
VDGATEPAAARAWLPFVLGVLGALVLVGVLVVALGGEEGADDPMSAPDSATDEDDQGDTGSADANERPGPTTSAARGPEGTRSLTEVPDEIPAGLVPDDARAIDGTVVRSGDDWSAAVVFRSDRERFDLEQAADSATAAAGFTRRDAVEDSERRVIRYDGGDGSVLTVTLRSEGEEVVVGAVLVSGGT